MARASSIQALPMEVQKWLDSALVEGNFSDYQLLEDAMRDKGYQISRSAIHRYGQRLERRMSAIKASTEAARLITEGASDDSDVRSEAVIALVQSEMFEAILSIQEMDEKELDSLERANVISKIAKNVATLSRASVNLKRYQNELKEKIDKKLTELSDNAESNGIDIATLERIKREVYGLL